VEQRLNPKAAIHQLDSRITELKRAKERARDLFLHKPMRKEEQNSVQRLERNLAIKTNQLAAVGRELLNFRHQLMTQEDEYNSRFGVDPSVAVLAMKNNENTRPATNLGQRLPRLTTPTIT
jgi:hypothetical protein